MGRCRKGGFLMRGTVAERFWAKVEKTETCWLWTGHLSSTGYGEIRLGGKAAGRTLIHRWSYEQIYGPIPEGLQIDHLCRVRHCVNHLHLEAVTPQVNVLRGNTIPAMLAAKTHCLRGHPLEGDNLLSGYVNRVCRACRPIRHRLQRQQNPGREAEQRRNNRRALGGMPHGKYQTHCLRGHLFDEANTRIRPATETRGESRRCRECDRVRAAAKKDLLLQGSPLPLLQ